MSHADQLARAGFRAGVLAADGQLRDALVEQRTDLSGQDEFADPVLQRGVDLVLRHGAQHLLDWVAQRGALRHRDPLVGQCGARQAPAVVDRAHHHVVGDEHIVEEHLVEQLGAGDLAQRSHDDARRLHVDDEVGDALVFRSVGIGTGQAHPVVRLLRPGVPHLLPGEPPTTLCPNGFHLQGGQIRACTRLTEQLTPDQLAAQRGRHELVDLLRRARLEDRRHRPPADDEVGPLHTRGGQFLIDEQLFGRRCVASVRLRPMRRKQTTLGHRRLALLDRQCGYLGDGRGDLGLQVGHRFQVHLQLAPHAVERECGHPA